MIVKAEVEWSGGVSLAVVMTRRQSGQRCIVTLCYPAVDRGPAHQSDPRPSPARTLVELGTANITRQGSRDKLL